MSGLCTYGLGSDGGLVTFGLGGVEVVVIVPTEVIPLITEPDGFEVIRDSIAQFLALEIAAQQVLAAESGYDPEDWHISVYIERNTPWDMYLDHNFSTPLVNVKFSPSQREDDKSNSTTRSCYTSTFDIDCYACGNAIATVDGHTPGDVVAAKASHKVARIIRRIIEHPKYKDLSVEGDIVWDRKIRTRTPFRSPPGNPGARHVYGMRLSIDVEHNETVTTQPLSILGITNIQYRKEPDGLLVAEISNGA